MMAAVGENGEVHFDGRSVVISREGRVASKLQGRGDKSIPLDALSAVQLQPPGMRGFGIWQVTIAGEESGFAKRGLASANKLMRDENVVLVGPKQMPEFEAITAAINEARAGGDPGPAPSGGLGQLVELHDRGVLSDEQFIVEVKRLV